MRILMIVVIGFLLCASCGTKDDPKYQTYNNFSKKINII